jgi:hypothetical protein
VQESSNDPVVDLEDLSIDAFEFGETDEDDLAAGHGMTEFGASGCHQQYPCHCSCYAA